MKFDKDTLIKQKFWVILASGVFFTLLAVFFLLVIVPRSTAKLRADVEGKWKAVKDLKEVKTPKTIEVMQTTANQEKANETVVWKKASDSQINEFFWAPDFARQFDFQNGLFATEIAVQKEADLAGLPPDEPKKEEPKKDEVKKDEPKTGEPKTAEPKKDSPAESATGKFYGKLVEFNPEYIVVQGRDPKEPPKTFHRIPKPFVKVTVPDEAVKAPLFANLKDYADKGAVVAVSYFRIRRFGDAMTGTERDQYAETYKSQLLDILKEVGPTNELGDVLVQFPGWHWGKGKDLPPPESRFFRYVPKWDASETDITDEAWAAQEDLWIQRDLFRLVKKANDSVANFEPVRGMPNRFVNPYWQIDVGEVGKDKVKFTLTNRLDRPQAVTVQFRLQFQPSGKFVPLEPIKTHDPLAPKGTAGKDSLPVEQKIEGPAGKQVVGVRQVLTWETAAVRRIDYVSIGSGSGDEWSLSQRNAFRQLQPFKKKPEEKKEEDPNAANKGMAPPGQPGGVSVGKPAGPMIPGAPGVPGGAAGGERSPHGLILDRYFDVTPQSRRVPVAVVLIVDQAHASRVQTAFADSPLRFLVNQVIMNRYPKSVRPDTGAEGGTNGMPAGVGPFGPKGGPTFPPMFPPGGGKFGPGRGSPMFPPGMGRPQGPPMGMPRPPGSSMGGRPYPGSSYPGMPGSSFGGTEQPAAGGEEQESNLELVIYGVVSLYEPYPPRPPLVAAEAPAPATPEAAPVTPPAKQ